MALLPQAAQAAKGSMPQQTAQQQGRDDAIENNINQQADAANSEEMTPEEVQQLEEAMDVAMLIIHQEGQQGDQVAQLVLDNPDVAKGIGDATATVLMAVGKQMDYSDDIKIILAMQIFMELTRLAVNAGALAEDEIDDGFIDASISHAYSTYLTNKEAMGELDQAELQQSVDEAKLEAEKMGIVSGGNKAGGLMGKASGV